MGFIKKIIESSSNKLADRCVLKIKDFNARELELKKTIRSLLKLVHKKCEVCGEPATKCAAPTFMNLLYCDIHTNKDSKDKLKKKFTFTFVDIPEAAVVRKAKNLLSMQ